MFMLKLYCLYHCDIEAFNKNDVEYLITDRSEPEPFIDEADAYAAMTQAIEKVRSSWSGRQRPYEAEKTVAGWQRQEGWALWTNSGGRFWYVKPLIIENVGPLRNVSEEDTVPVQG